MNKKIAILGSSGGNLFNLGGSQPNVLLGEIIEQCNTAGINISKIQFTGASTSMDNISNRTTAKLYSLDTDKEKLKSSESDKLKNINVLANESDKLVAKEILNNNIDGLIIMSADPKGVNKKAIEAAAEKKIPIVGTGGTAMAHITSMGGNVIATSGTTGTTNRTRAISAVSNLAKHWNIKYSFSVGSENSEDSSSSPFKRIKFRGIMMSALPAFISLAIILALSRIPGLEMLEDVFDLLIDALPVVLAAIAAKQISGLDETGIVAGIVAGFLSIDGGIIGGIIAGILAGLLAHYLFSKTVQWNFPMTTVNIVTGGISGLIAGLFVYLLIAPVALVAADGVRNLIDATIGISPILAGAIAGLLIWPAMLGGVYHAAILPIILLELEQTGNSFLGAIDIASMGMVAVGINLANIIAPRTKGERTVAFPGFLILMGFGTYVESAYPFMFSNKVVFGGALFSGGLAGEMVGLFGVRGVGYVPLPAVPFLSNDITGMILSMLIAMISALIITIIANKTIKSVN